MKTIVCDDVVFDVHYALRTAHCALISVLIIIGTAAASPIPLSDHGFLLFDHNRDKHYLLTTPQVSELWDIHNITIQFSNRYYHSNDTGLVNNRWLLHFADSINFRNIDFNYRIRLDAPGNRVSDAGWTSRRAGDINDPGFVYDPDRMVAHYTPNEHFKFGFGKDRYNWGPLEIGGLLLSDYNEGFTGFYQQYTFGSFVLRGLTAQLNSIRNPANRSETMHRYFAASRLEYYRPAYGFAVGQSMLYTGQWRSWDMRYFFPFYIFHYAQMTDGGDYGYGNAGYNSQGSVDGYGKIYRLPLEIYGELLIDDWQAHSDELSRTVQNCYAWMLGLRLIGINNWYGFIEGGRISTYTYNHKDPGKQFAIHTREGNFKSFIGSPLGPDQELLWGQAGRKFLNDSLGIDLNFWLRRSGERGINFDIKSEIENLYETKGDPQPYGIVEDELSFWASILYRKFFVDAEFRAGTTMYRNRDNKPSDWVIYPFFGVFLSTGISVRADR